MFHVVLLILPGTHHHRQKEPRNEWVGCCLGCGSRGSVTSTGALDQGEGVNASFASGIETWKIRHS